MKTINDLEKCIEDAENYYFTGDMGVAYKSFLHCEKLALEFGEHKWIAATTKDVGKILHRIGKYKEA